MADTKLIDLTAVAQPAPSDLVYVTVDPAGTPLDRKATVATVGRIVQTVNATYTTAGTGTTTVPADDTIPQNTEGDEFFTLAITPTKTTNKLRILVIVHASCATADRTIIVALFQDTTADALQAVAEYSATAQSMKQIVLEHYMAAGTISATTFKVRVGPSGAGTITLNGAGGARLFGGVYACTMTIEEIAV